MLSVSDLDSASWITRMPSLSWAAPFSVLPSSPSLSTSRDTLLSSSDRRRFRPRTLLSLSLSQMTRRMRLKNPHTHTHGRAPKTIFYFFWIVSLLDLMVGWLFVFETILESMVCVLELERSVLSR